MKHVLRNIFIIPLDCKFCIKRILGGIHMVFANADRFGMQHLDRCKVGSNGGIFWGICFHNSEIAVWL